MVLATPGLALACTQVYMGSSLTASGDTIYGREEDYASRHVKVFGVQSEEGGCTYASGESDFSRTVGHTYRYTYVRDTQADWKAYCSFPPYSEAGINEEGVTCSATLTTAANDAVLAQDPIPSAGLGEYNIADVVLGEAATARDGVVLMGKIIDSTGSQDCNQIWIGDANEVWNFQQLSGHQWIAVKMSSDVASVNPNMGNLQYDVDIDDESVCLHSADLVKVAQDAGTYKAFSNGHMNVALSYGEDDSGASQYTRYAQGRAYLGAALGIGDYTTNSNGAVASISDSARQLFFTPGRSDYSLYDMQRLLAARGVGSDFDANAKAKLYAIGNNRGVESHLFQTRKGLSSDIATIQWEALSRTEFSVYVPSYSALLTEVPEDIYSTYDGIDQSHTGDDGEGEDSVDAALTDGGDNMDYVLMDINTLTYNNRAKCGDGVAAYLKALQTQVNSQQSAVDALMQRTAAGQARTDLANKAFASVSSEVYKKAYQLRKELREYLKGDQSKPFAASDLNSDGTLKAPLGYAAAVVAPSVTQQPTSATYTQGDATTPLTVTATELDGVTGSDALLTYQWYEATDKGQEAIKGATSATYTPDVSAVGARTYFARVTNAAGLTTDSDKATVTVVAPKEAPQISAQPASATYTQGDTATPLSVTATDPDGDNSTLAFQWYELVAADAADAETSANPLATTANAAEGATNMVPLDGATAAQYTPDTSQTGTRTYMVRVTDADGLTTDSAEATVTVNAKPAAVPTTSTTQAKKSGGSMPGTGDAFDVLPPVLVAVAGAAVVCLAVALRRRQRD